MDPVDAWIAVRAMEHAERMEMIRHGMMPPGHAARAAGVAVVLGLAAFLLAAAFLVGLCAIAFPVDAAAGGFSLLQGFVLALAFGTLAAFAVRGARRRRQHVLALTGKKDQGRRSVLDVLLKKK